MYFQNCWCLFSDLVQGQVALDYGVQRAEGLYCFQISLSLEIKLGRVSVRWRRPDVHQRSVLRVSGGGLPATVAAPPPPGQLLETRAVVGSGALGAVGVTSWEAVVRKQVCLIQSFLPALSTGVWPVQRRK